MSLYDTLGVSPHAGDMDIKAAYRKKASAHHPDRADGNVGLMQQVQHAYAVLSDPARRAKYDATGDDGGPPTPRQKAIRSLPALLDDALSKLDPEKQNMLNVARDLVVGQMAEAEGLISELDKLLEKQEKVLARLTVETGPDVLVGALHGLMAREKSRLFHLNEAQEIHRELLKILDDHSYQVDAPPWADDVHMMSVYALMGRPFG